MNEVRPNYAQYIADEADEARLARNLQAVRTKQEQRRVRRARVGASLATVIACALLFTVYDGRLWRRLSVPGPLTVRYREGLTQPLIKGDVLNAGKIWLDDGSRIAVGLNSRVEIAENTGQRVHGVLQEGWARFEVNPGGPRKWLIDTGAFAVEVVGTSFTVSRGVEGTRVRVHRGRVQVRGAMVRGGALQLLAGEQFAAVSGRYGEPRNAKENDVHSHTQSGATVLGDAPSSAAVLALPAIALDEPASVSRDRSAEALRRADQLRAGGYPERASRVLARELDAQPNGREAGLVAFTLAQVQLDNLRLSAEAARSFSRAALAPTLPSALREQAMARRVEAFARAGLVQEAQKAAATYARAYGNGAWADAVRRWTAATSPALP
jgi:transmembrane sensor